MKRFVSKIGISRIKPAVFFLIITFAIITSLPIAKKVLCRISPLQRVILEVLETHNNEAIPNHEVWIEGMSINGTEDLQRIIKKAEVNEGFEFRRGEQYGYNNDVIVNVGGTGSRLVIAYSPYYPIRFSFWNQNLSGQIRITIQDDDEYAENTNNSSHINRSDILDLFSQEPEKHSSYSQPARSLLNARYALIVLLVSLTLSLLAFFAVMIFSTRRKRGRSFNILTFFSLFISISVSASLAPFIRNIGSAYLNLQVDSEIIDSLTHFANYIFDFFLIEGFEGTSALFCFAFLIILTNISYRITVFYLNRMIQKGTLHIEERNDSKSRYVGIDTLKCIGAIFVMLIHCYFENGYYERSPHSVEMVVLSFFYSILLCCIPVFIVSTGFLMCKKQYSLNYFIGWMKYLVTYFIIILSSQIVGSIKYGSSLSFSTLLYSISIFNNGYMSMFFGLYLLIPALNWIISNCITIESKEYLILGLLFLTIGQSILGRMFTRYWVCLAPFCYYLFGAFLRENKIVIRRSTALILILVAAVMETVFIHSISKEIINQGSFWNAYNNYENTYYIIPTFIITVLISIVVANLKQLPKLIEIIIRQVSTHSLELYLLSSTIVHGLVWQFAKKSVGESASTIYVELIVPVVVIIELASTFALSVPVHSLSSWLYHGLFSLTRTTEKSVGVQKRYHVKEGKERAK